MLVFVIGLLLTLLALALRSRRFAIGLALCTLLSAIVVALYSQSEHTLQLQRISTSALLVKDAQFTRHMQGYRMSATLTNTDPQYRVTQVQMVFFFLSCALQDESNCHEVAKTSRTFYVGIDPGASVALNEIVHFPQGVPQLPPDRTQGWRFAVEHIAAGSDERLF